jgi:hypothetical protein
MNSKFLALINCTAIGEKIAEHLIRYTFCDHEFRETVL